MNRQPKTSFRDEQLILLIGRPSSIIRDRCPKDQRHWPIMECQCEDCPWWVNGADYKNCSFLAAEVGEHTLAEIGIMMGVSRERVRQIEKAAIEKLQHRLDLRDIQDEFVYQQGLALWDSSYLAPHSEHLGEDESNFVCDVGDGNMGVQEW